MNPHCPKCSHLICSCADFAPTPEPVDAKKIKLNIKAIREAKRFDNSKVGEKVLKRVFV